MTATEIQPQPAQVEYRFRDFHDFTKDESGAVTTDWVVVTAAIVGLAIFSVAIVRIAVISLSGDVVTSLGDISVSELRNRGDGGEEEPESGTDTGTQPDADASAPEDQSSESETNVEDGLIIRGTDPQRRPRS